MIIKELEGKYDEISDSISFYQPFLIHIWVGISKDSENSMQAEPETCRKKNVSMLFQGEKSLYIISRSKWVILSRQKLSSALEVQLQMGSWQETDNT